MLHNLKNCGCVRQSEKNANGFFVVLTGEKQTKLNSCIYSTRGIILMKYPI